MSEKPEALALADAISYPDVPLGIEAAAELRRQHEEIERLTKENERLRDELRQSSIDITRAEVERLREENRLWYSRAVALFWKCDTDNITVARLQSAAKEIEAALRREEA